MSLCLSLEAPLEFTDEIEFHPAKERPATALFLAFSLGILGQALWSWLSPLICLALWSALVLSLRDFFLPTFYRFGDSEFTVEGPLRFKKSFPWKRFRSYQKDRNGLFLSPYRKKRATEGQRGVFLALRPAQRNQIADLCLEKGLARRGS